LKENGNAYESKNRSLDCDNVRHLIAIHKVPDFLLDRHTFIIIDGPCVRVSAGQVLQIGRNKDAAPHAIVLTTIREVHICILLLTACTLGWWWCGMFNLDNSLGYNWSETIETNRCVPYCIRKPLASLDGAR
jgi:hypothetical protein